MINIFAIVASLNAHPMPPMVKWDEHLFDDRVVLQVDSLWTVESWNNPFLPGVLHLVPAVRGAS